MYVSYLLEKDGPMYPGPVRHSGGLNLAAQNFVGAPQYADYGGYHVNLDGAQSPGSAWPAPYAAPLRDDWGTYGQGAPPDPAPSTASTGAPPASMAYSPADYHHHHHHPHAPPPRRPRAPLLRRGHAAPQRRQRRPPPAPPLSASPWWAAVRGLCEWMRKPAQPPLSSQGKCGPGADGRGLPRRRLPRGAAGCPGHLPSRSLRPAPHSLVMLISPQTLSFIPTVHLPGDVLVPRFDIRLPRLLTHFFPFFPFFFKIYFYIVFFFREKKNKNMKDFAVILKDSPLITWEEEGVLIKNPQRHFVVVLSNKPHRDGLLLFLKGFPPAPSSTRSWAMKAR
uniref:Caudal-like activation domain-containing protein n=1 Tax=Malurus cyaneus samueli TaxID=2593467 RepID=A0A8C5TJD3_9PASS